MRAAGDVVNVCNTSRILAVNLLVTCNYYHYTATVLTEVQRPPTPSLPPAPHGRTRRGIICFNLHLLSSMGIYHQGCLISDIRSLNSRIGRCMGYPICMLGAKTGCESH